MSKFTNQKKKELNEKECYIEDFKKNIINNEVKKENKREVVQDNKNASDDYLSDSNESVDLNKYLCFSSDDEK